MPSYEEVTQRAGSLRAMTGLTHPEFTALLTHFERAFLAYMADHTIRHYTRLAVSRSRPTSYLVGRKYEG
jgi:hypothetical protein